MNQEVKEIYDVLMASPELMEVMRLTIAKGLTGEQIDKIVKAIEERGEQYESTRN